MTNKQQDAEILAKNVILAYRAYAELSGTLYKQDDALWQQAQQEIYGSDQT